MDVPHSPVQRWGDDVPGTPLLDKFLKMAASVDPGLFKELKQWWAASHMTYPDWLLYYFASQSVRDSGKVVVDTCTYYNYQHGNGRCNNNQCQRSHTCVVCGKEGHGALDYRRDKDNYVCGTVWNLFEELQKSKQTWDDVVASVPAKRKEHKHAGRRQATTKWQVAGSGPSSSWSSSSRSAASSSQNALAVSTTTETTVSTWNNMASRSAAQVPGKPIQAATTIQAAETTSSAAHASGTCSQATATAQLSGTSSDGLTFSAKVGKVDCAVMLGRDDIVRQTFEYVIFRGTLTAASGGGAEAVHVKVYFFNAMHKFHADKVEKVFTLEVTTLKHLAELGGYIADGCTSGGSSDFYYIILKPCDRNLQDLVQSGQLGKDEKYKLALALIDAFVDLDKKASHVRISPRNVYITNSRVSFRDVTDASLSSTLCPVPGPANQSSTQANRWMLGYLAWFVYDTANKVHSGETNVCLDEKGFWEAHAVNVDYPLLEDFILTLCKFNPNERPSVTSIKYHPFTWPTLQNILCTMDRAEVLEFYKKIQNAQSADEKDHASK